MISYLSGKIVYKKTKAVVLDVRGVGYCIQLTERAIESVREGVEQSFYIHTAVREDSITLFGFLNAEELELFELLISVSGIGPRSALGIIGLERIENLSNAIAKGDVGYLTKVSGVGKKSAEKIVLELKEKIVCMSPNNDTGALTEDEDTIEALKVLGYRTDEAREALRLVSPDITQQSARIKEALSILSKR